MSRPYIRNHYGDNCFYRDSSLKRYNRYHSGGDTLIFNYNYGCNNSHSHCGGSFWGGFGTGIGLSLANMFSGLFGMFGGGMNMFGGAFPQYGQAWGSNGYLNMAAPATTTTATTSATKTSTGSTKDQTKAEDSNDKKLDNSDDKVDKKDASTNGVQQSNAQTTEQTKQQPTTNVEAQQQTEGEWGSDGTKNAKEDDLSSLSTQFFKGVVDTGNVTSFTNVDKVGSYNVNKAKLNTTFAVQQDNSITVQNGATTIQYKRIEDADGKIRYQSQSGNKQIYTLILTNGNKFYLIQRPGDDGQNVVDQHC